MSSGCGRGTADRIVGDRVVTPGAHKWRRRVLGMMPNFSTVHASMCAAHLGRSAASSPTRPHIPHAAPKL